MASETFTSKQTTVKADWCNDLDNFFYTIFGGPTTNNQIFTINGGGNVKVTNDLEVGDPGTETDGININGTTYDANLRVNDIGGSNPAQLTIHRHSTIWPAVLLGARSNSDDNAHADVTSGQNLFLIYGSGWTGSHYDLFGLIGFQADTGTISATSSPGRLVFFTTPDGSNTLTEAMRIDSSQNVGIGTTSTAAKLHVDQSSTTAAEPVLYLDQADISEEMIEFNTTIGVGNAIEAVGAKTLTTTHFIKVTLPGSLTRYIPCGTIA